MGFNKPANMTGPGDPHQTSYPAPQALDGYISPYGDHCAHPRDSATTPAENRVAAEWMTDLGALYKIYNITVYGKQDSSKYDRVVCFGFTNSHSHILNEISHSHTFL